jgi:hypothetical protein
MMNQNSTIVTGVAVAVMIGSLIFIFTGGQSSAPRASADAWFYDTVTKTYFKAPAQQVAPIDHDGNEAVRAHFFTCGGCGESERFLGYYEKYRPDVHAKLKGSPNPFMEEAYDGRLMSLDGVKWFAADGTEAATVHETLRTKCPDKLAYCPPD